MDGSILIGDRGDWVEITLNRPDKLNALNEAMCADLLSALESARREARRAVLLTGAGRGFCTGQDLGGSRPDPSNPPDLGAVLRDRYNPVIAAIRELEAPVICAVNGAAAGAGMSLALACDIVLASQDARFVLPFARIGLVPGAGSSWTLIRAVGEARARALAMLGEPVTAAEAEDWGMIWKAVPGASLMDEARAMAARLAVGPTFGLAQTKKLMQAAAHHGLAEQMEMEAAMQTRCGQSRDHAEGVAAFLDKRAPRFDGAAP